MLKCMKSFSKSFQSIISLPEGEEGDQHLLLVLAISVPVLVVLVIVLILVLLYRQVLKALQRPSSSPFVLFSSRRIFFSPRLVIILFDVILTIIFTSVSPALASGYTIPEHLHVLHVFIFILILIKTNIISASPALATRWWLDRSRTPLS